MNLSSELSARTKDNNSNYTKSALTNLLITQNAKCFITRFITLEAV